MNSANYPPINTTIYPYPTQTWVGSDLPDISFNNIGGKMQMHALCAEDLIRLVKKGLLSKKEARQVLFENTPALKALMVPPKI